jgi:hypothetical protein
MGSVDRGDAGQAMTPSQRAERRRERGARRCHEPRVEAARGMSDQVNRAAIRTIRPAGARDQLGELRRTATNRRGRRHLKDVGLDLRTAGAKPFGKGSVDVHEIVVRGEPTEAEHTRRKVEAVKHREGTLHRGHAGAAKLERQRLCELDVDGVPQKIGYDALRCATVGEVIGQRDHADRFQRDSSAISLSSGRQAG